MNSNGNGRGNRAWAGFDFLTIDSGINPLVASYEGAPYAVRGTDPVDYARNARDWWGQLAVPATDTDTTTPVEPASWFPSFPGADTLKQYGIGIAGAVLALIVVAVGLVVLVRSE